MPEEQVAPQVSLQLRRWRCIGTHFAAFAPSILSPLVYEAVAALRTPIQYGSQPCNVASQYQSGCNGRGHPYPNMGAEGTWGVQVWHNNRLARADKPFLTPSAPCVPVTRREEACGAGGSQDGGVTHPMLNRMGFPSLGLTCRRGARTAPTGKPFSLSAGAGTGQAQGEWEAAAACRQCSTKKPLGNINRCDGQQSHLAAVLRGAADTQPGGWAAEGLQESSPSRGQGW